MTAKTSHNLRIFLAGLVMAGSARAAETLWLHVIVDEGEGDAKVTVNLPLALVEKALPMLPFHERYKARWHFDREEDWPMHLADIRELWAEVRDAQDMTFITVDEEDESVKVWKESGFVYVEVRDRDGGEQVDVKLPISVVDALLQGDEINFSKAVEVLADEGGGDIVSVRDHDEHVRVWVDDVAEARTAER